MLPVRPVHALLDKIQSPLHRPLYPADRGTRDGNSRRERCGMPVQISTVELRLFAAPLFRVAWPRVVFNSLACSARPEPVCVGRALHGRAVFFCHIPGSAGDAAAGSELLLRRHN